MSLLQLWTLLTVLKEWCTQLRYQGINAILWRKYILCAKSQCHNQSMEKMCVYLCSCRGHLSIKEQSFLCEPYTFSMHGGLAQSISQCLGQTGCLVSTSVERECLPPMAPLEAKASATQLLPRKTPIYLRGVSVLSLSQANL